MAKPKKSGRRKKQIGRVGQIWGGQGGRPLGPVMVTVKPRQFRKLKNPTPEISFEQGFERKGHISFVDRRKIPMPSDRRLKDRRKEDKGPPSGFWVRDGVIGKLRQGRRKPGRDRRK